MLLSPHLYEQIGRLKMELEWLKKKLPSSVEAKRAMIDNQHPGINIPSLILPICGLDNGGNL